MSSAIRTDEINSAREMVNGWIQAEKAVMTGQEYQIGTRRLRRADLREIRESIKYWKNELTKLEGPSRILVRQIIPRDM